MYEIVGFNNKFEIFVSSVSNAFAPICLCIKSVWFGKFVISIVHQEITKFFVNLKNALRFFRHCSIIITWTQGCCTYMAWALAPTKTFHGANKLRHTMNITRWSIGHQPNLDTTTNNETSLWSNLDISVIVPPSIT
jgi:hypothetical protein